MLASRLLVTAILATPGLCLAGGSSWPFTVTRVEAISPHQSVISLSPVHRGTEWPESCPALVVRVQLPEPRRWQRRNIPAYVDADSFRAALAALRRARREASVVRFGSMGAGLAPDSDEPCSATTHGLAILEEHDGETAIYSFR